MTEESSANELPISLPALERIDRVCLEFEAAWKSGQPPRLEDFLDESGGAERGHLLRELLLLELDYRARSAEQPTAEEYLTRLPNDSDLIASVFEDQRAPSHEAAPSREANYTATLSGGKTLVTDSVRVRVGAGQTSSITTEARRFRVLRRHARGGLGEVYLAQDEELNREVALKEIQEQHAEDAASRARFCLEAEVTGGLEHPGIAPVYCLGEYPDGRPFYAMRFVRGESLKDAIKRFHESPEAKPSGTRSIAFRQILGRFVDVCQTVEYAHSRGVLHRDLKPANIMLGKFGETLVVDWGLAKATGEDASSAQDRDEPVLAPRTTGSGEAQTATGAALGTPQFMSPEQAAGQRDELGPASDIYSLGATLYTLLTGKAPFAGDPIADVLRKVQIGEFATPRAVHAHVPRPLEAVCLKAMARDPGERYESARNLSADIEAWLADQHVSAYREPATARMSRWMRNHRGFVLAATTAILVAVLGLSTTVALLATKNRELGDANVEIADAKQRADERFDVATEAIEEYYTGVSEDLLLKEPGFKDLRNRLLQSPLLFYGRLLEDLQDDPTPESRSSLAEAFLAIARITEQVGSLAQTVSSYQQAAEIFEQLVETHPTSVTYRSRLVACLCDLAIVQKEMGEVEEALAVNEKAVRISKDLVADSPGNLELLEDQAALQNNIGLLQLRKADVAKAKESLQEAVHIQKQLVNEHPELPEYQSGLASKYQNVGTQRIAEGKLDEALDFCEEAMLIQVQLAEEYSENSRYLHDRAKGHNAMGRLQRRLNRHDEAIKHYAAARRAYQELTELCPNVVDFQRGLAFSHRGLAAVFRDTREATDGMLHARTAAGVYEQLCSQHSQTAEDHIGLSFSYRVLAALSSQLNEPQESLGYYRRALDISEKVALANPEAVSYQCSLAESCYAFATRQHTQGELDEALLYYRRAIQVYEDLAKRFPDVPSHQSELVETYTRVGGLLIHNLDKPVDAIASFDEAIRVGERLIADYPNVCDFAVNLGGAYCNRAHSAKTEDLESSLAWYAKAISVLEKTLKLEADDERARKFLQNSLHGRALPRTELGHSAEAISDWDRVLELAPPKQHATFQILRARTRAKAGDHLGPAGEADQLAAKHGASGWANYNAACVFSLASAAAGRDKTIPDDVRAELVERYAARAVALIQKAR